MGVQPFRRAKMTRKRNAVGHAKQHEDRRIDDTHLHQGFHLPCEADVPRDAIMLEAVMLNAVREIHQRIGRILIDEIGRVRRRSFPGSTNRR